MKAIIILSVPQGSLTEETRENMKKIVPDSVAIVFVEETQNPEKWGITIVHDETIKVTKL